jgi:hypothetical protein
MTTYQFEVDGSLWENWKKTVPRTKPLDERIRELIRADLDGRVRDPHAGDKIGSDEEMQKTAQITGLSEVDFPSGRDYNDCTDAVHAAGDYIKNHGSATMRELVDEVMPAHPVGYDVPELEEGERYRGAWWRSVVKPGLRALEEIEEPPQGGSDWKYAPSMDGRD